MTENDTLVERLSYHHEDQVTGKLVLRNPDGPEAATRIAELERQLAEAREAVSMGGAIQAYRTARALSGKGE